MPNPFALLDDGLDDDESGTGGAAPQKRETDKKVVKNNQRANKKAPSQGNERGPTRTANTEYRGGQEDERVRDRKSGRGGRGGRGNRAGGRQNREPRGEKHQSQGKRDDHPEGKKSGRGQGNWGNAEDDLKNVSKDDPSKERPDENGESPEVEEEEEPDNTITLEDFFAMKKNNSSKTPEPPKLRMAGEGDDGNNYKKADNQIVRGEEEVISIGQAKKKHLRENRKGRATKTEVLQVDLRYGSSDAGMDGPSERDDRGGRGRSRGRGDGRGRGRGRDGGENRQQGGGRGGRGSSDNGGRGRGRSDRSGRQDGYQRGFKANANDFPAL